MEIYLVDGTYELFRHYFAVPSSKDASGQEIGAVRGVLLSVISMLAQGVTHIGVATDHVIESFRNELWPGYKTSEGVEPELLSQFPILEEALWSLGVTVWPMVREEADDALGSAAKLAAADKRVKRVVICTPDKDLGQCVSGTRTVQLNRRTREFMDENGVVAKFGVRPESIPDYLALVGDSADGYPGIQGWGAKKSSAVLAKFKHLEAIPPDSGDWGVRVPGAAGLAARLKEEREKAILFRTLATLKCDLPLFENVDQLEWKRPTKSFASMAERLGGGLVKAVEKVKR